MFVNNKPTQIKQPYENIYIGTFLFTLGYMFRDKSKKINNGVGIELYQQTRDGERTIGDLLTSVGGKNIIIEFKRQEKEIKEELTKKSKKKLREKLSENLDKRFNAISSNCHFLSIPAPYKNTNKFALGFTPYIKIVEKDKDGLNLMGINDFCSNYLDVQPSSVGVDHADFAYYLKELTKISNGTCGGLAISIDDSGIKAAVVFEDVRDLQKSIMLAEKEATLGREEHEKTLDKPVPQQGFER